MLSMRHASNHQNLSLPTNSQQRPKSGHRHDSHNAKPIQREEELPAPQKGSRTEFEDRIRRALSPSHPPFASFLATEVRLRFATIETLSLPPSPSLGTYEGSLLMASQRSRLTAQSGPISISLVAFSTTLVADIVMDPSLTPHLVHQSINQSILPLAPHLPSSTKT